MKFLSVKVTDLTSAAKSHEIFQYLMDKLSKTYDVTIKIVQHTFGRVAYVNFINEVAAQDFYDKNKSITIFGVESRVVPLYNQHPSVSGSNQRFQRGGTSGGRGSSRGLLGDYHPPREHGRREYDDDLEGSGSRDNVSRQGRHSDNDDDDADYRRDRSYDRESRPVRGGFQQDGRASTSYRGRGRGMESSRSNGRDQDMSPFIRNNQSKKDINNEPSHTLYAGGLDPTVSVDELYQYFGSYGHVINIERKVSLAGSCFCFVKFLTLDMAVNAKEAMTGIAVGRFVPKLGFGLPTISCCLWIGGLGEWTTQELLHTELAQFGEVEKLLWPEGRDYAFVVYQSVADAKDALTVLNGSMHGEPPHALRVSFADYAQLNSDLNLKPLPVLRQRKFAGAAANRHSESREHSIQDNRSLRGPSGNGRRSHSMDRARRRSVERSVGHGHGHSTEGWKTGRVFRGGSSATTRNEYLDRSKLRHRSRSKERHGGQSKEKRSSGRHHHSASGDRKKRARSPYAESISDDEHQDSPRIRKRKRSSSPRQRNSSPPVFERFSRSPVMFDRLSEPFSQPSPMFGQQDQRTVVLRQPELCPPTSIPPFMPQVEPAPYYPSTNLPPPGFPPTHLPPPDFYIPNAGMVPNYPPPVMAPNVVSYPQPIAGYSLPPVASHSQQEILQPNINVPQPLTQPKENHALKFPKVWSGALVLKNGAFVVNLHLVSGSVMLVNSLLGSSNEPGAAADCPVLKIAQRLRLDQPDKLDELDRRLRQAGRTQCSVLLAASAPAQVDDVANVIQQRPLEQLVLYLRQKQVAAVVPLPPGCTDQAHARGVLHAFPACQFSTSFLERESPGLGGNCPGDDQLLVIVCNT